MVIKFNLHPLEITICLNFDLSIGARLLRKNDLSETTGSQIVRGKRAPEAKIKVNLYLKDFFSGLKSAPGETPQTSKASEEAHGVPQESERRERKSTKVILIVR
jgi:hypothetical protein